MRNFIELTDTHQDRKGDDVVTTYLINLSSIKYVRKSSSAGKAVIHWVEGSGDRLDNCKIFDQSYEQVCALIAAALTPPPSQP